MALFLNDNLKWSFVLLACLPILVLLHCIKFVKLTCFSVCISTSAVLKIICCFSKMFPKCRQWKQADYILVTPSNEEISNMVRIKFNTSWYKHASYALPWLLILFYIHIHHEYFLNNICRLLYTKDGLWWWLPIRISSAP